MEISVVIPTYKRPVLLQRCIEALMRQDLSTSKYEIIVVDDAASEETWRQVADWAILSDGPAVSYLSTSGKCGPATARNRGWRAAKGKLIAFTDDDTIPDKRWLSQGIAAFKADPDAIAASGRVIVPLPDEPTDYERNEANLATAEFVTANCFVRRNILEALGGFDERFRAAWREDSDLHFRLLAHAEHNGGSVIAAREAKVVHPVRPASWGISLWQQSKAQYNALLYKLHPLFYQQKIQHSPPWLYYSIAVTAFACFLFFFVSIYSVAIISLLVWAAQVMYFCAARLSNTSRKPLHVLEMLITSAVIPFLSVFWRIYGAFCYRVIFF
ncbi:MAG TPA: glycosyltransferase [Candidatus Methylacidiphilales bacterium]|nr:glycosyltransferase [Candidatus Methylacidiphilales bacterium]